MYFLYQLRFTFLNILQLEITSEIGKELSLSQINLKLFYSSKMSTRYASLQQCS